MFRDKLFKDNFSETWYTRTDECVQNLFNRINIEHSLHLKYHSVMFGYSTKLPSFTLH